jgi:hypothetical protein
MSLFGARSSCLGDAHALADKALDISQCHEKADDLVYDCRRSRPHTLGGVTDSEGHEIWTQLIPGLLHALHYRPHSPRRSPHRLATSKNVAAPSPAAITDGVAA